MNYFSTELRKYLDGQPRTRKELAEEWGLAQSNISQFARGTAKCGAKQLAPILTHVEEDVAIRLAVAWLKDNVPKQVDPNTIAITPRTDVVREEPSQPYVETDEELRNALNELIRRSNKNPVFRKHLIFLARSSLGRNYPDRFSKS